MMNAFFQPFVNFLVRGFALLVIVGSSSCGGGGGLPSIAGSNLVPISIVAQVPGQLVAEAESGLLQSVFDIAIGDAHAAIVMLGVQSISVNISGPGFTTITDIFNTTPGTLISRNYDVPFGNNRQITINGFNAAIGAGGIVTHTGTAIVTLAETVPGAAAIPIIVNVPIALTDIVAPVISLLGANPLFVQLGTTFNDPGSNVTDNVDVGLVSNVTGVVNHLVVGTYTLAYNVSDAVGNAATQQLRSVIVTAADITAPVITLLGSNNPISHAQNVLYFDAGATANDNFDGNVTANITTTNTVDTNILGAYQVTYTVTDVAGNTATKIRTVRTELDSDADAISDVSEIAFGSNPNVAEADHDGDKIFSRTELELLRDPLSAASTPVIAGLLGQTDSLGVLPANALTNAGGNGDTGPYGLSVPRSMDIDPVGNRLFVADSANNRIVVYALTALNKIASRKAIAVLGQTSFEYNQKNRGGSASASTLNSPSGVSYVNDAANGAQFLVVTDNGNNRVLIYNITAGITTGMAATIVLGQADLVVNAAGLTSTTMNYPKSARMMVFGAATYLVVCDSSNNRTLLWNIPVGGLASLTNGKAADVVLGQPNFTSSAAAVTNASHSGPSGLAQWNNFLLISDTGHHRVLAYDLGLNALNGMPASAVLGQIDLVSGTAAITASGLNTPNELEVWNNHLFVADHNNSRVLVFNITAGITNGMAANFVYGQVDMLSKVINLSQNGFGGTYGLAMANNTLLVSDDWDDEVMEFDLSTLIATQIPGVPATFAPLAINNIGQSTTIPGMADGLEAVVWNAGGTNDTGPTSLDAPKDSVVGVVAGFTYLFVADELNDRVLAFKANASGVPIDMQADFVFGHTDYDRAGGNLTQWGLSKPSGVAFDSVTSTLYISDTFHNRVVVYDLSAGMNKNGLTGVNNPVMLATTQLGQANFISGAASLTVTGLNQPSRLVIGTLATVPYLFVTDSGNDRVLVYDLTNPLLGNDAAAFVLGAADFISNPAGVSLSQMATPVGIDFDPVNKRLFVASAVTDRVLVWDFSVNPISNGMPASWMLGQTNAALATGNATPTVSQWQLDGASDVAFDTLRNVVWVTDLNDARVLGFDIANGIINGMNASYVIGQADYVSKVQYLGANNRTAFTTAGPSGLTFGPQGHLILVDETDDRMLIINP